MMTRQHATSGSPYEAQFGFSRAVRAGNRIVVAGTGPVEPDGSTTPGDVAAQATRCFEIIIAAIEELAEQHEMVAMIGDGVNDAPALKKADIGVAMGVRGTDVARSAADLILLDDNFRSIIAAVDEGRRQFDNIRKFVRYILSAHLGEVAAIFLNIVQSNNFFLFNTMIFSIDHDSNF